MNENAENSETAPRRFSDGELARRLSAVRAMMAEQEIDALLLYSTAGSVSEVQYLADFRTAREAYLVVPAEGECALFVQYFNHVPYARLRARVAEVQWAGSPDPLCNRQDLPHGLFWRFFVA